MASSRSQADRDAFTLPPEEPEEPGEDIVPALLRQIQLARFSCARSRAVLSATYSCLDAAEERLYRSQAPAH
jgi:hypothetical protein